jgi:hypothetical protein
LVLIKFDKSQEPANMYSASLDTKSVALDKEALQNVIVQKYPDGSKKKLQGDGKKPAMWNICAPHRPAKRCDEACALKATTKRHQRLKSPRTGLPNRPPFKSFRSNRRLTLGVDPEDTEVSPAPAHLKAAKVAAVRDEAPALVLERRLL